MILEKDDNQLEAVQELVEELTDEELEAVTGGGLFEDGFSVAANAAKQAIEVAANAASQAAGAANAANQVIDISKLATGGAINVGANAANQATNIASNVANVALGGL